MLSLSLSLSHTHTHTHTHTHKRTDTITNHIASLEFETTTEVDENHDISQDGKIRPPSYDTYKTLWSIDQCIVAIAVTYAVVYGNIFWYC